MSVNHNSNNNNNTLDTLPENYPQFSFNNGYGKYRANSGFLQEQRDDEGSQQMTQEDSEISQPLFSQAPELVAANINLPNSNNVSLNSVSSVIHRNPLTINNSLFGNSSMMGTVKITGTNARSIKQATLDKYNSSKFDNLQAILDDATSQGTMIHHALEETEEEDGTTRIQKKVDENKGLNDLDKENVPLWMRHLQLKKAQLNQETRKISSDISRSGSGSSKSLGLGNGSTPASSLNRSPETYNDNPFQEKSIHPITQSTAVSTYNSRPNSKNADDEKEVVVGNSGSNFGSLPNGQQSPLKLFSSDDYNNYNTYTKEKMDNLISQYGNEHTTDSSESTNRNFDSENSIRFTKPQLKTTPDYSVNTFGKLASINEVPSPQDMTIKSGINPKTHSRGNSHGTKSLANNNKESVEYFQGYANDVFDKIMRRGPGVASKESLTHSKSNNTMSESYTSDDTSYNEHLEQYRESQHPIKSGQGRLSHPSNYENLIDDVNTKYEGIQNVTNNMSSFDTFRLQPELMVNDSEGYTNTSQKEEEEVEEGDDEEEEEEEEVDETTFNHTATFIQPKLRNLNLSSPPKNESFDDTEENYDYDMNASFMKELGGGTGKFENKPRDRIQNIPNNRNNNLNKFKENKKLIQFAPGEIEIPNVPGMIFDQQRKIWLKRKPSDITEISDEESLDLSKDDNVNALNAIADLSTASQGLASYDSDYEVKKRIDKGNMSEAVSSNNNTLANNTDITFNKLPNVSNVSQIDTTFSQTKKALVSALIDALSKNKNWELVKSVDLSKKKLVSINEFDTLLPNLRIVNLDFNLLRNLEGLPNNVDNISGKGNKFSGLLSLKKYRDLEILDFSNNFFKTLQPFKSLIHLRDLNLSGNLINNINALNNSSFQNLLCLDLSNNYIKGQINFKKFKTLQNLREINLSDNYIESIDGIKYLTSIVCFKADNNELRDFSFETFNGDGEYHKNLKKLSLKNNRISEIELKHFKNLRVLRINYNIKFYNLGKLHKLDEVLINGSYDDNDKLKEVASDEMNLEILKQLVEFNTIKTLNVSNTKISSLEISQYISLDTLYCLFNNINNFQTLVEDIKFLNHLKKIDLRFNPITDEFYEIGSKREILNCYYDKGIQKQDENMEDYDLENSYYGTSQEDVKTIKESKELFKGILQEEWERQDDKFVENLKLSNKQVYKKRVYYQGLMLTMFKRLRYLDGLIITPERRKKILQEFERL